MTGHSEILGASDADATERIHRAQRVASVIAAIYVVAWVVGLVLAPNGPGATDSATSVHAYYGHHGGPVVAQSLLIHGLAGVCLLVLARTLPVVLTKPGRQVAVGSGEPAAARRWAWLIRSAGTAAALVSFTQVGLAIVAAWGADGDTPAASRQWLSWINHLDTCKLILIAAFVAGVTGMLRTFERPSAAVLWLRRIGVALIPLLVLGGSAFLLAHAAVAPLLNALLALSLLLLLVWAGVLAFVCRRRQGTYQCPSHASR